MANYEITYWNDKGEHQDANDELRKHVPASGSVENPEQNPKLERFRIASNCYYDLYNNGLWNRGDEFKVVFGFDPDGGLDPLEQWVIDQTETAMDRIILDALAEQVTDVPLQVPAETRTIEMGLTACCGSGKNTTREMTKEQYDYIKALADELSLNDGDSTDFTVPFFYVADWGKPDGQHV